MTRPPDSGSSWERIQRNLRIIKILVVINTALMVAIFVKVMLLPGTVPMEPPSQAESSAP